MRIDTKALFFMFNLLRKRKGNEPVFGRIDDEI